MCHLSGMENYHSGWYMSEAAPRLVLRVPKITFDRTLVEKKKVQFHSPSFDSVQYGPIFFLLKPYAVCFVVQGCCELVGQLISPDIFPINLCLLLVYDVLLLLIMICSYKSYKTIQQTYSTNIM